MNQITKEALEFLNEAREAFANNSDYFTYQNKEKGLIALRGGLRDDCIMVYELGKEVGNFTEQLPRQHKVLIDYDELEKYKKLKENLTTQINKTSDMLQGEDNINYFDYKHGYLKAMKDILNTLN